MDPQVTFLIQFVMSLVVYSLIYRWYVGPWLAGKTKTGVIQILLLPHAFRYIGLLFLMPSFVASELPSGFADATAYGDLITAILAIITLFVLRAKSAFAMPLVWLTNLVGTIDLLKALSSAGSISNLGVVVFIPAFIVPLLLVSHVMIFVQLLRPISATSSKQRPF